MQKIRRVESEIKTYNIQITLYFFSFGNHESFTAQAQQLLRTPIYGLVVAPSFVEQPHTLFVS